MMLLANIDRATETRMFSRDLEADHDLRSLQRQMSDGKDYARRQELQTGARYAFRPDRLSFVDSLGFDSALERRLDFLCQLELDRNGGIRSDAAVQSPGREGAAGEHAGLAEAASLTRPVAQIVSRDEGAHWVIQQHTGRGMAKSGQKSQLLHDLLSGVQAGLALVKQ